MHNLTPKQQAIYDFMRSSLELEQRIPTYRDICKRFGIASPNVALGHLKALRNKGWIEISKGRVKLANVDVVLMDSRYAVAVTEDDGASE